MFLKRLNPVQLEAVTFGDGPLLILAGAGSGKTSVLTSRVAYLVLKKGVHPSNILAVTFTNKAAGEMRERLVELIGHEAGELWLGTFHSLGLKILRREHRGAGGGDRSSALTVYGDDDQLTLVKEIMGELKINEKTITPRAMLSRINQAKNDNVPPSEYLEHTGDFFSERVSRVYTMYQKRLREMGTLDFGDLICEPIRLLKNSPHILHDYQKRFKHILVDEYQDTNRSQYILTNLMAEKARNLFAVGDPDQSIYAWRGADISNILDFERDYPDATVLKLEQNYRSTKSILSAANSVIEKNFGRMKKELWTENPEGARVIYEEANDEYDEARLVVRKIKEALDRTGGLKYGDMAVFYRTNAQSRVFEEKLIREGIPYSIVGGVRFYDRKEIKDAVAYLRVMANPADAISFKRIINTPPRGIGKAGLDKIHATAKAGGLNLLDATKEASRSGALPRGKAKGFIEAVEAFKRDEGALPLHELALRLLEDSGYMISLQDEGTEEALERVENLFELISAIKDFEAAKPDATLTDFLDHVSLISDIDSYEDKKDRLTLMTIHSAKGLEFRHVFIAGMEEGLFARQGEAPSLLREDAERIRRVEI
jgi:DNA helicase-2/ATP-dependent DNA helicase PcrA